MTGISGSSCSLRRRLAGYGLASSAAIISSVTTNGSGSSVAARGASPAARVASGRAGPLTVA